MENIFKFKRFLAAYDSLYPEQADNYDLQKLEEAYEIWRVAREVGILESIKVIQARHMGDHNREDQEVVKCVQDLYATLDEELKYE